MVRHCDDSAPIQLGLPGKGNVEIINVKSAQVLDMLLYGDPGILPAYHMNKKHWITILLGKLLRRKGTPRSAHGELSFNSKT